MKQLKSSTEDLRQIFEETIAVRHIAAALVSFDADARADEVRSYMQEKDFDHVGVRRQGLVCGLARRERLSGGTLGEYQESFAEGQIVDDTASIAEVVRLLPQHDAVFVRILGQVGGIVTHGDLRKAPVRMWLFGLVSLLEMQMLRIIRECWPDETWRTLLNCKRVCAAEKLFNELHVRNEALELVDCLQFCDKRDIILSNPYLWQQLGLPSKGKGKDLLENIEDLRDALAHAGDFLADRRMKLVEMIDQIKQRLEAAEKISVPKVACADAMDSD